MLRSLGISRIWQWLVLAWFGCGLVATILGFTGLFYPIFSLILVVPFGLLLLGTVFSLQTTKNLSTFEKLTVALIALWWLLHSLQVFVPETGFDALWYHLPLAQQTLNSHRFIGDINFYQSFNPQFSDSIFYLGFAAMGELGAKIVAYAFGLTLILTTYVLSHQFLKRPYALVAALLVSSFQVVSWQSSSFYIDIAKAVWELSALIFILQKADKSLYTGLSFGASLASKLFSILLLPLMLGLAWFNKDKKGAIIVCIVSLLVALPYYLFAYSVSGTPFYSASEHIGKLQEIGNAASLPQFIFQQTLTLPKALWEMVASREYTTPLTILFFPLLFLLQKEFRKNKLLLSLVTFSAYQLVLWWFLPPTSTRYALAGFITTVIFVIYGSEKLIKQKTALMYGLLIVGVLAMPIRIVVATRSWQYLSGQQTKQHYLEQFLDGNIDQVLKKWHKLD